MVIGQIIEMLVASVMEKKESCITVRCGEDFGKQIQPFSNHQTRNLFRLVLSGKSIVTQYPCQQGFGPLFSAVVHFGKSISAIVGQIHTVCRQE